MQPAQMVEPPLLKRIRLRTLAKRGSCRRIDIGPVASMKVHVMSRYSYRETGYLTLGGIKWL